mmetsp:Transcript_45417/g.74013  ORF Transcript_45417/g.74013 Transcript_45417/m.74013 type:complete len:564 (-) Transcript_45417:31-1722(-)
MLATFACRRVQASVSRVATSHSVLRTKVSSTLPEFFPPKEADASSVSRTLQIQRRSRSYATAATATEVLAADVPKLGKATPARDPRFSRITDEDIKYFKSVVSDTAVLTDEHELEAYNVDWMRKYRGKSQVAIRPKTAEHVSKILGYCNARKLAVVPQGGNTGLVGGSVPVHDEVVINLGAMNQIISFDEVSGILVCEAGCILEALDNFLAELGFMMPLDLGAKGSCQIGGNVSTNAGGLRLVRYGSLHGTVIGLQVVLADGTIIDNISTLRKDNTGYHLNHLFIGSEGTLGIVTAVSIVTPRRPKSTMVALLACEDFEKVQKTLIEARKSLGEILSAIEYLDRPSMDLVLAHQMGVRDPLPDTPSPFYVLIEVAGSNAEHDEAKLNAFLEQALEQEVVVNGAVAQDETQMKSFWKLRETITESLSRAGAVYKYDISIPLPVMFQCVEDMRKRLGDKAEVVSYGHIGDGNLHLNIYTPQKMTADPEVLGLIEPYVYEWTASKRGSISAEHGLGVMKANHIHYSKTPESVQLMTNIKSLLDPNNILNPYKVLPTILPPTPTPAS